jgi:Pyridoxamine 5'-phosphate oxidase
VNAPRRGLTGFTDIVGSTVTSEQFGDESWRALLDHHDQLVYDAISRFAGRHVAHTGDGVSAIFDRPAPRNPDVVPVWPAWRDDTVWIFSHTNSVKVRNIAANPNIAPHWQVDESGDGVELWGTATVDTDSETKRRLWTGVFTYNLDDFAPEGLDSPDNCFIAVRSACWR